MLAGKADGIGPCPDLGRIVDHDRQPSEVRQPLRGVGLGTPPPPLTDEQDIGDLQVPEPRHEHLQIRKLGDDGVSVLVPLIEEEPDQGDGPIEDEPVGWGYGGHRDSAHAGDGFE